mgnify:CR=1 FL=1
MTIILDYFEAFQAAQNEEIQAEKAYRRACKRLDAAWNGDVGAPKDKQKAWQRKEAAFKVWIEAGNKSNQAYTEWMANRQATV